MLHSKLIDLLCIPSVGVYVKTNTVDLDVVESDVVDTGHLMPP